ncbi:unnamed protein product [Merluccius merluccius]
MNTDLDLDPDPVLVLDLDLDKYATAGVAAAAASEDALTTQQVTGLTLAVDVCSSVRPSSSGVRPQPWSVCTAEERRSRKMEK